MSLNYNEICEKFLSKGENVYKKLGVIQNFLTLESAIKLLTTAFILQLIWPLFIMGLGPILFVSGSFPTKLNYLQALLIVMGLWLTTLGVKSLEGSKYVK